MNFFNLVTLFGGLAFFLYGMSIMGSGLEKLAGGKTESILQKLTSSTVKGVVLGAIITALIQSSSGTTVIIIGLVNSGIMQFKQAIGVIMGANIGTTVTAQILRLSDLSGDSFFLQLLKPSTLAPAIAIVGAVLYVFMKNAKRRNIGQIMLGFGILFAGMFSMEEAVMPLRDSPWFYELFATLQNPILGVLAGAIVTGIIQSSAASIGILQALTATGAITWANAVPIILGQNIGTCVTGMIASVGASRAGKRVAISHVYFNVVGTVLWLIGIYITRAVGALPFWENTINMGGIANFHTLFNVITTIVFIPLSGVLVKLTEWTVRDVPAEHHPELTPVVLDERLYGSPGVAIAQARNAVEQMATLGRLNQKNAIGVMLHYNEENIQLAQQRENVIDKLDVNITNYLVGMTELELSEYESREVTTLLNFVTEFERIGDYAINVVERSGEVADKRIHFSAPAIAELEVLDEAVGEILDMATQAFVQADMELAGRVEPLEETVDAICETLRERHIMRLKQGECSIEAGIIFLEVLNDYERISDHCSNVAARLLTTEDGEMDPHSLRRSQHAGDLPRYNELIRYYREKYRVPLIMEEQDGTQEIFIEE
ncbi:Na/Pi cotransporter family protein [Ruminococcaceae bacterium OttesenSCG-928-O06]|nr:Na/Pi cotransporter family protein [Ruminococcaceae bacterium OttesenSCG-928-O06]